MKKTVLTFGLISGLIISVLMGGSLLLADKIGSGHSMSGFPTTLKWMVKAPTCSWSHQ